MAVFREDIASIDLENGTLFRSFLNHAIGEGDASGNRYGFRAFRNNAPVDLSGCSVTGYFIRADKTTVIIEGITEGNKAYVLLPATCYAIDGNFSLAIKITGGGTTGTIRIVDGTVVNTVSDSVVDPGGAVPEIDELMAVIERAEDAAQEIASFSVYEELISGDDYRLVVNVEE